MIVIDSSAYVEFLIGSRKGEVVRELLGADQSAVPHLFDAEVLHVLVTLEKRGIWRSDAVSRAIQELRESPMERFDHGPRLMAASRIASALSGYDALYAVLAVELDAGLVTVDERFARTASSQFGIKVADLGFS